MQVLEDQLMFVSKDHITQQQIIKGKRTKRQRLPSPLRLAMPASNNSYNECTSYNDNMYNDNSRGIEFVKIESHNRSEEEKEEEDMANCLILLAQGHNRRHDHQNQAHVSTYHDHNNNKPSSNFYLYECKTCNRCFPSFQALGGHRASHSKPNKANCNNNIVTQQKQEATTSPFVDDPYDPTMNTILSLQAFTAATPITTITTTATKRSKVHECSICGAEFSSGQALGGHMRRHRTLVSTSTTTTTTTTPSVSLSIGSRSPKSHEAKKPRINGLKLDLNLPAPEVDQRDRSKFSFQQPRENVIAFSNSSLVDCHY